MAKVKDGDKVLINYIGKLEDGSVFDTTYESHDCGSDDECDCEESGPMEFTIGAEEFCPQVDRALIGMEPGEKKNVIVPAADAFGEYDEEKVFTVGRDEMPEDLKPEVGDELTITNDDEDSFDVTVVAVAEDCVTFDANHPLAGEDLTFEIELVEIR